jgi:hypothetical protein
MQINHSFDLSPDVGAQVEVLGSSTYFVEEVARADDGFDCAGTVGTFGSVGGCAGTFGSFGCCC